MGPGEQRGLLLSWVCVSVLCTDLGSLLGFLPAGSLCEFLPTINLFGQGDAVSEAGRKGNNVQGWVGSSPSSVLENAYRPFLQKWGESGSEWRIIENNDDEGLCLWPLTFPQRGIDHRPPDPAHSQSNKQIKRGQWVKGPRLLFCSYTAPSQRQGCRASEQPGSVFKMQWSFSAYSSFCAWTDLVVITFASFLDRAGWPLIWRYSFLLLENTRAEISALRNF